MPKLILASASPARANLLRDWGFAFEIRSTDTDEGQEKKSISDPKTLVETLALKKYHACPRISPEETILTADTIIHFNGQLIGKPIDRADACHIIQTLSGQTHQVWTGVCINATVFSADASVSFKSMSSAQITALVDTNEWVGAAGGYRIMRSIKPYVANITGDINTIIGLPTQTTSQLKLLLS